ncbi:MAG: monooxygenase [Gammaproteobacteria bacterium]|nr:monooxygenase [Gammaproteobacteria bacterium]
MKLIIAGAGIGGTTAALCLLEAGFEVQLLERTPTIEEVGAGIQCGANALRVLKHLGLLEQIIPLAVQPEAIEFRDYQSGDQLYRMPLGDDYARRYGAPYLHIHRADLQRVLLDALQQTAPDALCLGAEVAEVVEAGNEVQVRLGDGRTLNADGVVGADGARSRVRNYVLGEQQPRFTGNVAWRAVVPADRLAAGWMECVGSNFVGPRQHAVLYYLRGQRLANLVAVVENPDWTDDSWVARAPWSELHAEFAGWHPMVQAIIEAVDKDQCFRWALYDHQPFDNWSTERVTLLGDAAHATLPFMASGAALAIEDARVLARALQQADSLADGLQLYQRNRMARTAKVQRSSALMGHLYHIDNNMLRRAAFAGLRLAGGREAFLPEYDANQVPLT